MHQRYVCHAPCLPHSTQQTVTFQVHAGRLQACVHFLEIKAGRGSNPRRTGCARDLRLFPSCPCLRVRDTAAGYSRGCTSSHPSCMQIKEQLCPLVITTNALLGTLRRSSGRSSGRSDGNALLDTLRRSSGRSS